MGAVMMPGKSGKGFDPAHMDAVVTEKVGYSAPNIYITLDENKEYLLFYGGAHVWSHGISSGYGAWYVTKQTAILLFEDNALCNYMSSNNSFMCRLNTSMGTGSVSAMAIAVPIN